MMTVVSGNFNLDFDQLDLLSLLSGSVTVANAIQLTTSDSGVNDNFFGSFTYNGAGQLTEGTMTRLQETYFGQLVFDITASTSRWSPSCSGL